MQTFGDLQRWAEEAPAGTMIPAEAVAEALANLEPSAAGPTSSAPAAADDWRTRLWTVPSETRLGVAEVAEALNRPRSYVYARTGPKADVPLPHRRLDGCLSFTAGELRTWVREREVAAAGLPMAPPVDLES